MITRGGKRQNHFFSKKDKKKLQKSLEVTEKLTTFAIAFKNKAFTKAIKQGRLAQLV